ncbi:MAG TPA: hypothetical protein VKY82_00995 [Flavobacterium sp.]|nr:hypothetical protein [Flavobacterium sp.]
MKNFIIMIGGSLCAWFCCDPEDDVYTEPYESIDRIAVLIVDDVANEFEGGEYYHYYNQQYLTYNLQVENVPAADTGYIKVQFVEGNQLIYHASQIFNGSGTIIVPNPLKDPSYFDRVSTEDFANLPQVAIELTNGSSNEDEVQKKWAAVQNLLIVRMGLELENPKIHYFKQNLGGGFTENNKWVFIVKF